VEQLAIPNSMTYRAFMNPAHLAQPNAVNSREWRAAEIPAANGHTNARGLATMYGALACEGEWAGKRLLKPETVKNLAKEQSNGIDKVLFAPTRFSLGFMMHNETRPFGPKHAFGHTGSGGSLGFVDLEKRLSFGYTMNQVTNAMNADPRWDALVKALYQAL